MLKRLFILLVAAALAAGAADEDRAAGAANWLGYLEGSCAMIRGVCRRSGSENAGRAFPPHAPDHGFLHQTKRRVDSDGVRYGPSPRIGSAAKSDGAQAV